MTQKNYFDVRPNSKVAMCSDKRRNQIFFGNIVSGLKVNFQNLAWDNHIIIPNDLKTGKCLERL